MKFNRLIFATFRCKCTKHDAKTDGLLFAYHSVCGLRNSVSFCDFWQEGLVQADAA